MSSRRLAPVLLAGPVVGAMLYLPLRLLAPASAREIDDPWAAHFRSAGMEARLRSISRRPMDHFAIIERRDEFRRDPELAGTVLTLVEVDRVDVQIAEFPGADVAARMFEEGRHKFPKNTDPGLFFHVHRVGRYAAIVPPLRGRPGLLGNASGALVTRILRTFASRAGELEGR